MGAKKKLATLALVLIITMTAIPFFAAYANRQTVVVTVNNMPITFADQGPLMDGNRVLVPVRGVFEEMGFYATWDPESRIARLTSEDMTIIIPADSQAFVANNQIIIPDVPQQMVNNRLLLPLRAISEVVGWDATWDSSNRAARITSETTEWYHTHTSTSIPNRKLTYAELNAWIADYHSQGGSNYFELEILHLVNIERENAGLQHLAVSPTLMMSARFKAQSMSDIGYFSHENPVSGHFANISRQLFNYPLVSMGENIARGQITPQEVVRDWMDSPSHRINILHTSFTEIGVGFYNGHWVQKFGNVY